jgi:hypothetical protein
LLITFIDGIIEMAKIDEEDYKKILDELKKTISEHFILMGYEAHFVIPHDREKKDTIQTLRSPI